MINILSTMYNIPMDQCIYDILFQKLSTRNRMGLAFTYISRYIRHDVEVVHIRKTINIQGFTGAAEGEDVRSCLLRVVQKPVSGCL